MDRHNEAQLYDLSLRAMRSVATPAGPCDRQGDKSAQDFIWEADGLAEAEAGLLAPQVPGSCVFALMRNFPYVCVE